MGRNKMEKINNVGWVWSTEAPYVLEEALDKINELIDEVNKLAEDNKELNKKINSLTSKTNLQKLFW